LGEQEFNRLFNTLLDFNQDSLLTRKRLMIVKLASDETYKELINVLICISLELPTHFASYKVSRNRGLTLTLEDALGLVLVHLLEGDRISANKAFLKLPYKLQIILAPFLSNDILKLGRDFLFDTIHEYLTLDYIISNLVNLPEPEKDKNLMEKFVGGFSTADLTSLSYPFYAVATSKHNKNPKKGFRLGFVTLNGNTINTSSSLAKVITKTLLAGLKGSYGFLFLYQKNKNATYLVQILASGSSIDILRTVKGKTIDTSNLSINSAIRLPKSVARCNIIRRTLKLVENKTDLGKIVRRAKKPIILSVKGFGLLELESSTTYEKVVDFQLNEDYEAVGFVIKKEGELVNVGGYISEELVQAGLSSLYLRVKTYKYRGEVILEELINTVLGTVVSCAVCGNKSRKPENSSKPLCWKHWKEINAFAKSNCGDSFEFDSDNHTKVPVVFNTDKYQVTIEPKKIILELNLELMRGKQFSLPFDYTSDW
jgi:hypothetical protein